MAFLGNFFSGFKKSLLKCIRNSVTTKEGATRHFDEKEGLEPTPSSFITEEAQQVANDNTSNNNELEKIAANSDSPSDYTSSFEKIGDEDVSHEYADNHELIMEDVFKNAESTSTEDLEIRPRSPQSIKEKPLDAKEVDGSQPWTFEVCCNLTDKIPHFMSRTYQPSYISIGTLQSLGETKSLSLELEECKLALDKRLECAILAMKHRGYHVAIYSVKWSNTLVILFDLSSAYHVVERYRFELQRDVGILIPQEDTDATDAVAFGYLVAEFVAQFSQECKKRTEELQQPDNEKIQIISRDWSEAICLIFLNLWKVVNESFYKPSAKLQDAFTPTNFEHRLKIESLAREIASEDVDV